MMTSAKDTPDPVAKPRGLNKEVSDRVARPEKVDRPAEKLFAVAQASNDAAATASKNAAGAYKIAEEATSRAAEANKVALSARNVAVVGALFGAGATVVALLAVYVNLINN